MHQVPQGLPVFVISFNRSEMLKRVIQSYRTLSTPTEVVIHDNGSTDAATQQTLRDLENEGLKVVRRSAISHPDELNLVDETVREYFAENGPERPYVVTDCDIDLSCADDNVLDVYLELLETFPEAECVGPMLRIRDVPTSYSLFTKVMNRHIKQFWRHAPSWVETSQGRVAFQHALIDTTFAVHRAGAKFHRHKKGLRVYEPYEALHLDWYPSQDNSTYHNSSHPEVSHWDNSEWHGRFNKERPRYRFFTSVERDDDGQLVEVRRFPLPNRGVKKGGRFTWLLYKLYLKRS